jgi:hypothetical protein
MMRSGYLPDSQTISAIRPASAQRPPDNAAIATNSIIRYSFLYQLLSRAGNNTPNAEMRMINDHEPPLIRRNGDAFMTTADKKCG